jgi:hypothetical protein
MASNENRSAVKSALQKRYGSLRAAAKALDINYFRLGTILNGWVDPRPEEWMKIGRASKAHHGER